MSWDVVTAKLLGVRTGMDREVVNDFSRTGVMHVLSVSGLHVGILYLILKNLFSILLRRKRLPVICTVVVLSVIWIYALMTGLSPSILRSAFMFSIILGGEAMKRRNSTFNSLFCSAFFLLCAEPGRLFDIGFQLSYSARIWNPGSALLSWLWSLISVSMAAQLATLPASLFYFHAFPTYFLLSNIVAVPATGLIIGMAIAAALSAWIASNAIITAALFNSLEWITGLLLSSLEIISLWPWSSIEWSLGAQGLAVASALIAALSLWLSRGEKSYLWLSIGIIFTSGLFSISSQVEAIHRSLSYVLSSGGGVYLGSLNNGLHRLAYIGGGDEDERKMEYLCAFWTIEGFGDADVADLSSASNGRSFLYIDGNDHNWLIVRDGRCSPRSLIPGYEIDGIIFLGKADKALVAGLLHKSGAAVYLAGMKNREEGEMRSICDLFGREARPVKYNDYIRLELNRP